MWPSSTSYQSEADEGIDGSQGSEGSLTASVGVIGRKNLRADAPAFKASSNDTSFSTPYESVAVEPNATSDQENYYAQEAPSDYPYM